MRRETLIRIQALEYSRSSRGLRLPCYDYSITVVDPVIARAIDTESSGHSFRSPPPPGWFPPSKGKSNKNGSLRSRDIKADVKHSLLESLH